MVCECSSHRPQTFIMRAFSTLFAAAASLLASTVVHASLPSNLGTFINLRIEGANTTIFEDIIFTRGHKVTTASNFTLECNGLNNHTNPKPGPTPTSALDDASLRHGFTWDGYVHLTCFRLRPHFIPHPHPESDCRSRRVARVWNDCSYQTFLSPRTFFEEFDDLFISRIADSEQTTTEFWGLLVNFTFTPVGGCQQEVAFGDHVLWAFNAFGVDHFLKLDGPSLAVVGRPATFTVTDGMNGTAIANATVVAPGAPAATSDAEGKVKLTFRTAGIHSAKASRADSIRSNAVTVLVA